MYTINLQIPLVTFTIKTVTHRTRKTISHYHQPDALCKLLLITQIINFKKGHLLKRTHSEEIIDYSFTKLLQPRKHENNDKNVIIFTRTYNPNHQFSFSKFKNCIKNTTNTELQKAFNDNKKILLTTQQPKKLRNLLVPAKFETKAILQSLKLQ